jgi:hypothetical protein
MEIPVAHQNAKKRTKTQSKRQQNDNGILPPLPPKAARFWGVGSEFFFFPSFWLTKSPLTGSPKSSL